LGVHGEGRMVRGVKLDWGSEYCIVLGISEGIVMKQKMAYLQTLGQHVATRWVIGRCKLKNFHIFEGADLFLTLGVNMKQLQMSNKHFSCSQKEVRIILEPTRPNFGTIE